MNKHHSTGVVDFENMLDAHFEIQTDFLKSSGLPLARRYNVHDNNRNALESAIRFYGTLRIKFSHHHQVRFKDAIGAGRGLEIPALLAFHS